MTDHYFITSVSIPVNFNCLINTHRISRWLCFFYCTTLLAQQELAKASGLALKAKPIPMI
jgi:hypothetical protein